MKTKLSRILGVGLTLSVLASLLVVASPSAPVSAATLGFSNDSNPLITGTSGDIVDYAVAKDGTTIYAVQGTKDIDICTTGTQPSVRKSTNGGATWTTLGTAGDNVATFWYIPNIWSPAGATTTASIFKVAVAPDDPNTVAILATDMADNVTVRRGIYYSTNGGSSWTKYEDLNPIADFTANTTAAIPVALAISPAVGTSRYVAVAGQNQVGQPGVWYFATGGFASHWIDATSTSNGWVNTNFGGAGAAGAAYALHFSPNFAGDFTLGVVTDNVSNVMLQLANVNSKVWNQALYPGWQSGRTLETLSGGTVRAAALEMSPNFLGADASSRIMYVGLATGQADPINAGSFLGGVYRFNDYTMARLLADTAVATPVLPAQTVGGIDSVSVSADGSKIVAGAFSSNDVYTLAAPSTATAPATWTVAGSYKKPGGYGTDINGNQDVNKTLVAYGTGSNVYAGTSGIGTGDQSAFSASTNDGVAFNDISLIDNGAAAGGYSPILSIYVSPDASKMYYVSTASSGTGSGFISLLRKDTAWKRVLTIPAAAGTAYAVRVAPENADVVYLVNVSGSTTTGKQFFFANDGGLGAWLPRYSMLAPMDVAVESATTLYVLNGNQVSKSIDSGFTWDTAQTGPTTIAGMTSGANIQSISKDNILVGGGSSGGVAYSTNGYTSFTYVGGPVTPGAGQILVTADKLATGGNLYAVASAIGANIYRYTIGTSTSWQNMIDTSTFVTPGPGTIDPASGIELVGGALYVTTYNGAVGTGTPLATSKLYRTLDPANITDGTAEAWSVLSNLQETAYLGSYASVNPAGISVQVQPQNLFSTVGSDKSPKIWSIGFVPSYFGTFCTNPSFNFTNTYKIETFTDSLAAIAPALTTPADKATIPLNIVQGNAVGFPFVWSRPSLSTMYEMQIALDSNFTQLVTTATVAPENPAQNPVTKVFLPADFAFSPDTTYYWRVKTSGISVAGAFTDSDQFYSVWSATRSFKIGSQSPLTIIAPATGSSNVPVQPTFVWSPSPGATTYEIIVSDDPTFKIITFSRTTDKPEFAADEQLAYGTVYYWRVRASAPATAVTPFIDGIFTTMGKPVPPTTAPPPVTVTQVTPTVTVNLPPPVEAIPSYLLWIIIGIGAILVIALIVLVVRTRRTS